jgi:hypothetical protein
MWCLRKRTGPAVSVAVRSPAVTEEETPARLYRAPPCTLRWGHSTWWKISSASIFDLPVRGSVSSSIWRWNDYVFELSSNCSKGMQLKFHCTKWKEQYKIRQNSWKLSHMIVLCLSWYFIREALISSLKVKVNPDQHASIHFQFSSEEPSLVG